MWRLVKLGYKLCFNWDKFYIDYSNTNSNINSMARQLRRTWADYIVFCLVSSAVGLVVSKALIPQSQAVFLVGFSYFSYQAATKLFSRGRVDSVPDPISAEESCTL